MPAYLIVNTQVYPLTTPSVTIGRSLENQIVIQEPAVSRTHIEIRADGDHYVLQDLGSTGGTYVNGKKVDRIVLRSGDSILLSGIPLVFVQNTPQLEERAKKSTGPLIEPAPDNDPTIRENKPIWRLTDD